MRRCLKMVDKELFTTCEMYLRDLVDFNPLDDSKFSVVELDMQDVLVYSLELYALFRDNVQDFITLVEVILKNIYGKSYKIIFKNIPEPEQNSINEIRIEHLENLYTFRGMIKRKSSVFPKLKESHYLCTNPNCPFSEEVIKVVHNDDKVTKLKSCPKCKSPVDVVQNVEVDFQVLVLEELSDDMKNANSQPKRIQVHLEEALTDVKRESKLLVGSKVEVVGIVKKKRQKNNNTDTIFSDFYLEGYNVKLMEETFDDLQLKPDEVNEIMDLSKQENIIETLINSTAPNILGLEKEKLCLLVSIVGGSEESRVRTKIHSLFLGDPGKAKSKLLNFVGKLMPRCKYVSGEGSSGVGLTATAEKDEFTGGWTAEAGAIVQAHNGYLLLDELDKIKTDEQTKLNTAMEDGKVPLDKASISVSLNANATVIASANPKLGKFDVGGAKTISSQINIDKTLLSRFDLIILLIDEVNEQTDREIASFIFGDLDTSDKSRIELDLFRKYLFYAKKLKPKYTKESAKLIQDYFVELRKKTNSNDIYVSVRQLEGLKRIGEAIAKLKLKSQVDEEDSLEAIKLMEYSMKHFSESEILTGITNSMRSVYKKIYELVMIFKETSGQFTYDELFKHPMMNKDDNIKEVDIDKTLQKLKDESIIFEPRKNLFKIM